MIAHAFRVAAAVACLAAGCGAGFFAWANAMAASDPEAVLRIAPWQPAALLAQLEPPAAPAEAEASAGLPAQALAPSLSHLQAQDISRRLLRQAPLSDAPLAHAGILASQSGDAPLADRAFAAARRRNPRNIAANTWLATRAIDRGDLPEAIRLLETLIAIDPRRGAAYVEALAILAQQPEGELVVRASLAKAAPWRGGFIARLNARSSDLDMLVRANAGSPSTQPQLISRIERERGLDAAFLAWLNFLEPEAAAKFSWPFNPGFDRLAAPPPFNWTVNTAQAEIPEAGGLNVTYQGKGRQVLASETMLLGPGSYRFTAWMQGDAKSNGGKVAWSIACLPGGAELGRVQAAIAPEKASPQTIEFEVPAEGCRAQRLSLTGLPGEFPLWVRASTKRVEIQPAGRPAGAASAGVSPPL